MGNQTPSKWVSRPPLLRARAALGVARVGSDIFAVGGFTDERVWPDTEARHATGDLDWHEVKKIPQARANHATAVVAGLIYAIGGIRSNDKSLDSVEVYDPVSGHWTNGPRLPERRNSASAAGLGGLLYLVGGFIPSGPDSGTTTDSVLVHDPAGNGWTALSPMPTPREKFRLVALEDHLYALGGFSADEQSMSSVERYDPARDQWSAVHDMQESRILACVVATKIGHRPVIVAVAGTEAKDGVPIGSRRTTEIYDPAMDRWSLLDVLLPKPRGSVDGTVEQEGTVVIVGGVTTPHADGSRAFVSDVDALDLEHSGAEFE
ncbi:Kelch repeat-containing protein [Labedaea rhizosphaerae]|uniref:Kelch motif protein n=1 Tax=Labedaea rhizosphaerae TaxID=598644 RepID=A0A4R6SKM0_LABRH|nr:kelch repeat-containing protein [Labedaea rhizosphaerae]TDQ04956.1 Kelch motif protein [Labedaea rhizosphaerae]